jgi:hypothetical protein
MDRRGAFLKITDLRVVPIHRPEGSLGRLGKGAADRGDDVISVRRRPLPLTPDPV